MGDTCDVCGVDHRPVERTAVETIAPIEADVCRACQLVQDHEMPDGRCAQCGDEIGTGFHLEVEFPLGPAELPGNIAVALCGDCAGWVACRINYHGVRADEDAHRRHLELLGVDEASTPERGGP